MSSSSGTVSASVEEELINIEVSVGEVTEVSASDYKKLINKPSINGTELDTNYDEIDPTVPSWAKNETKPTYTASETGAIDKEDAISSSDILAIINNIF